MSLGRRPLELEGELQPRTVGGETLWVTENGAWAVVPRSLLERRLGISLDDPEDSAAIDLGLVLGTDHAERADAVERAEPLDPGPALPPPRDDQVMAIPDPSPSMPELRPEPPEGPSLRSEVVQRDLRASLNPVQLPREPASEGAQRLWYGSLAALGTSALLLVATGVLMWSGEAAVDAEPAGSPVPVQVAARPGVVGSFSEAPSARDAAALASAAGGEQAGDEAVRPEPAKGSSVPATRGRPAWQVHIEEGWRLLPLDASAAADRFRQAVALYPRHGGAYHGLGEALIAQGDEEGGATWLCEARRLDLSLAPRIDAVLREHGLDCAHRR